MSGLRPDTATVESLQGRSSSGRKAGLVHVESVHAEGQRGRSPKWHPSRRVITFRARRRLVGKGRSQLPGAGPPSEAPAPWVPQESLAYWSAIGIEVRVRVLTQFGTDAHKPARRSKPR